MMKIGGLQVTLLASDHPKTAHSSILGPAFPFQKQTPHNGHLSSPSEGNPYLQGTGHGAPALDNLLWQKGIWNRHKLENPQAAQRACENSHAAQREYGTCAAAKHLPAHQRQSF
eukprot:1159946-Pelagomonas_calceolata.AAC.7